MLTMTAGLTAICVLAGFWLAREAFVFGRRVAFIALVAISALAGEAGAQSVAPARKTLPQDARFCPSWAEAHERTLASLNNGRPPYGGRWKGFACTGSRTILCSDLRASHSEERRLSKARSRKTLIRRPSAATFSRKREKGCY